MKKAKERKATRELWRGHGVAIGVYEHGFTVSDVRKVPAHDAKGKPNKNAGAEVMDSVSYHSRLHHALDNAANRVARREAEDLKEYVDTYNRVAGELAEATRGQ